MSTQVQRRKGTTAQHVSFTGASAELTVDTTKNTVVVHDGATAGGIPLAKETGSTISATAITGPFNGSVGATTPSTGAFTTLTTTSKINGISVGKGGVDANGSALNTAIGNDALQIISSTRSGNVAVGASALYSSTNGRDNVAVGFGALFTNPLNSYNVAVGASALFSAEGSFNTAVGRAAGSEMSTGSKNTIIGNFNGFQAGLDIRTSDNFIVLSDGDGTPRAYWNGANPTFPGVLTLSDGTANGVPYLNGSKQITTGSALTFDGSALTIDGGSAGYIRGPIGEMLIGQDGSGLYVGEGYGVNPAIPFFYGSTGTTHQAWKAGGSEAMRLTSSGLEVKQSQLIGYSSYSGIGSYGLAVAGNVGIGTSSPGAKLDVNGGTNSEMRVTTSGSGYLQVGQFVNGAFIGTSSTDPTAGVLRFGTGGTERMRLDSSGNLLVGTTATNAALLQGVTAVINSGGSKIHVGHVNGTGTGESYAVFAYNGTAIGTITQNLTSSVLYNTTSDYRLKTVIGPVADAGTRIDSLLPVEYEWKADGSRTRGFLAHQFQEVYTGSVSGTKDAVDADGKPMYQAMQASSSEVIADLVAEIQSLRKRLAAAGIA